MKFSIERFADPKINVNYATLGSSIEKVDVVDDHTVKITLNSTDGAFLDNIAMFAAAIVPEKVVEKEGDKAFGEDPIGSGPVHGHRVQARPGDGARAQPALLA